MDLPEIQLRVGQFLGPFDLAACAQTARSWYQIYTPLLFRTVNLVVGDKEVGRSTPSRSPQVKRWLPSAEFHQYGDLIRLLSIQVNLGEIVPTYHFCSALMCSAPRKFIGQATLRLRSLLLEVDHSTLGQESRSSTARTRMF
jgi:hypothetical protein